MPAMAATRTVQGSRAPSLASQLLQGSWPYETLRRYANLWEPACWRWCPDGRCKAQGPHRRQASSYRDRGRTKLCGGTPTCGSRLAGDGVRMGGARLKGPIAGKPAPTGIVAVRNFAVVRQLVGAGLLAMVSGWTVQGSRAPSLASQLLQGSWPYETLRWYAKLWEPACWRWRPDGRCKAQGPHRRQAGSYRSAFCL